MALWVRVGIEDLTKDIIANNTSPVEYSVWGGQFFTRQGSHTEVVLCISLVLNTKKKISSRQVTKDCNLNQKTVWYRMIRIGKNMENRQNNLLRGILEIDET